jgi:succinyl-diaminopimelate desuccinylase
VTGVQGHVAYPHLADNPVPRLLRMLCALVEHKLDEGNAHFQQSNLEITSIDVGNPASNLIPHQAGARFNIRFNDHHDSGALESWLRETFDAVGGGWSLDVHVTGEAFVTPPGFLSDLIAASVADVLGAAPELSTTGGTSDARFIKDVCPVAEFGLISQTMHKVDERVALADLDRLRRVYAAVLERYFAT